MSGVELRHGRDLARISRELKAMDNKQLLKRFRRELRIAARPLVPEVRAAIRAIPSKRPYTAAGLRGRMASATRMEVKTTGRQAAVVIRVDGRKMPPGEKALQAYMEGTRPRWRHPVYGNPNAWVQQRPKPYFYKTVRKGGPAARRAVGKVMDGVTRDIR